MQKEYFAFDVIFLTEYHSCRVSYETRDLSEPWCAVKRKIADAIYLVEFLSKLANCADFGEVGDGAKEKLLSQFILSSLRCKLAICANLGV